jgi:hypothetical protein
MQHFGFLFVEISAMWIQIVAGLPILLVRKLPRKLAFDSISGLSQLRDCIKLRDLAAGLLSGNFRNMFAASVTGQTTGPHRPTVQQDRCSLLTTLNSPVAGAAGCIA